MSSKLFGCAPEHVRPVTSEEAKTIVRSPDETSVSEIARQLPRGATEGITRAVQLDVSSFPAPMPVSPVETMMPPADVPVPSSQSSGVEDQPDQEPGVPVTPSDAKHPEIRVEIPTVEDPKDVPVPYDDDDDLVCEGLYCHDVDCNALEDSEENLAWRCEILVTEADIQSWRASDSPEEMSFLVSAAKRQRAEVKLSELSAAERAEFTAAKDSEISNWLKTGTVQKNVSQSNCPRTDSQVPLDPDLETVDEAHRDPSKANNDRKAKARLVVLGYLDPQITEVPRDSPTLNRHSKMLLLQLIASKSWDLPSFDIRAAVLQGKPQQGRVLVLEPVPELAAKMNLKPEEICRLAMSAYGLIDAPFL
eukprot:s1842_g4.t1